MAHYLVVPTIAQQQVDGESITGRRLVIGLDDLLAATKDADGKARLILRDRARGGPIVTNVHFADLHRYIETLFGVTLKEFVPADPQLDNG